MTRIAYLAPLASVVAVLLLASMPGGALRPPDAAAEDCSLENTGVLEIEIIDAATDDPLETDGTQVIVKPDPRDFVLDDLVTDTAIPDASGSQDRDPDTGRIRIEGACSTEGSESYSVTLYALPSSLEECDTDVDSDATKLAPEETELLTLVIDCTGVGPTPTVTVTATVGPAATVVANTSPLSVNCNGTSVISATVRDAAGNPLKSGTAVTITTTLGSISPTSGFVTNDSGTVFAFFTAPSSGSGTATVTAKAGSATGTATVNVNCGATAATATVAPPPATGSGGTIKPPNTGDGGLVGSEGDSAALIVVASVLVAGGGCWLLSARVARQRSRE